MSVFSAKEGKGNDSIIQEQDIESELDCSSVSEVQNSDNEVDTMSQRKAISLINKKRYIIDYYDLPQAIKSFYWIKRED